MSATVWGICGGSGSGKTYLTDQLVERMGADKVSVIPHDAYYHRLDHLSFDQRCEINYDHPDSLESDLLARHLAGLHAGIGFDRPEYDFAAHNRSTRTVRVDPQELIIVEGILIFASEELRAQFDLTIFLDVPVDIRRSRRLERDVRERGRVPDEVAENFDRVVQPMHELFVEPHRCRADIVVPFEHDREELLFDLTNIANEKLGSTE